MIREKGQAVTNRGMHQQDVREVILRRRSLKVEKQLRNMLEVS